MAKTLFVGGIKHGIVFDTQLMRVGFHVPAEEGFVRQEHYQAQDVVLQSGRITVFLHDRVDCRHPDLGWLILDAAMKALELPKVDELRDAWKTRGVKWP